MSAQEKIIEYFCNDDFRLISADVLEKITPFTMDGEIVVSVNETKYDIELFIFKEFENVKIPKSFEINGQVFECTALNVCGNIVSLSYAPQIFNSVEGE